MGAGNHAQGVAYHAQRLGLRAAIVMPRFPPGVKVERPRGFCAEVILYGDTLDEARVHAVALVDEGDIEQTLVMLLEVEKTLVEGAGAAGLAALRKYPERFKGKHVGLVLCGGNIDPLLLVFNCVS